MFDDSIKNFLGFHETILYKEYNLSPDPVDILSFDNVFMVNVKNCMHFYDGYRPGLQKRRKISWWCAIAYDEK